MPSTQRSTTRRPARRKAVAHSLAADVRRAAVAAIVCAVALVAALLTLGPTKSAGAAALTPRAPHSFGSAIEPLATYVPQNSCDLRTRPGTRSLANLLARTYRADDATAYNTTYACGTDGSISEHYDGRAIDWMVDIHNRKQHAAALSAINWMLATDKAGNRDAIARRLGIMYIIYDNRMWGAWDGRWENYNGCNHLRSHAYDNSCHRTHIHISLGWNGAMGRTSFWTGHVFATDYGPCRPAGLNWAYRYRHRNLAGCPATPRAHAGKHASGVRRGVVAYSGWALRRGSSGPGVTAVQRALGISPSGVYRSATAAAVQRFQGRHKLPRSGRMTQATWRSLLAVVR